MNKDLNSTHIYYFYQVNLLKGIDKKTIRREGIEPSFYLCSHFSTTLCIRKQYASELHFLIYNFLPKIFLNRNHKWPTLFA